MSALTLETRQDEAVDRISDSILVENGRRRNLVKRPVRPVRLPRKRDGVMSVQCYSHESVVTS